MTNMPPKDEGMQGIALSKDVFISYSHDDREYVHAVADRLLAAGYDCWIDKEDIPTAAQYNEVIFPALDQCLLFVVFMSRSYAQKTYCQKEYNRAIDKSKNIMLIRLDDVTEDMLGEKAYMFGYCAGQDIIGFDRDIRSMSPETVCTMLLDSAPFQYLKQYRESGDTASFPRIQVSHYILHNMQEHLKDQYNQDGNYLRTDAISPDLFPALREAAEHSRSGGDGEEDSETGSGDEKTPDGEGAGDQTEDTVYKDMTGTHVSLVEYLNCNKKQKEDRHVLLIGEGGFGKTVSLLETCRYLHEQNEYAMYIPLKHISRRIGLEEYIRDNICKGNLSQWKVIDAVMKLKPEGRPSVYLLLDGLNEISADCIQDFVNHLVYSFLPGHPGVQVLLTSRHDGRERFSSLDEYFKVVHFCYLDTDSMGRYIAGSGLPEVHDEKLLKILRTPLMLTLYCNAESSKKMYEGLLPKDVVSFFDKPDSVGKILHNYFQTQIFRATKEITFNQAVHLTLMEYILPRIGLTMVLQDTFHLSESMYNKIVQEPGTDPSRALYFDWYERTRLYPVTGGGNLYTRENAAGALRTVGEELVFLRKGTEGIYFSHQLFRDYFAAIFLSLEIRYLSEYKTAEQGKRAALQVKKFSDDILMLAADILGESRYEPYRENDVWICQENNTASDAEEEEDFWYTEVKQEADRSHVEQLFDIWRGREDGKARNAVSNLIRILRIGRNGKLFPCDLSGLDLRGCSLRGIRFSEYLNGQYYTSCFDNALIDKECFIPYGHSSVISAVSIPCGNGFFTGDMEGIVYRWDLEKSIPVKQYHASRQKIIRLVSSADGKHLWILTKHELLCLDTERETITQTASTHRYYSDMRLSAEQTPEITYDTAPLDWQPAVPSEEGDSHAQDALQFPLLSGCVRVSPDGNTCVYSDLYSQLRAGHIDRTQGTLKDIYPVQVLNAYISGKRIMDICWHPSGERVVVAYAKAVFEFAFSGKNGLELSKHVILGDTVNAVCYTPDDRMIVCHGIYITVFNRDFSVSKEYSGNYIPSILGTAQRDNRTYLLSKNGEMKLLDENLTVLCVRNMRHTVRSFCFAHDLIEGTDFICLLGVREGEEGEWCERYDFEKDTYSPMDSDYELEFEGDDHTDKPYMHYTKNNEKRNIMISIHRYKPISREYENIQGIYIQKCSFRHIRGTISEPENLRMITQNGGIVDVL